MHSEEHAQAKHPSLLAKVIMFAIIAGAYYELNKMIVNHEIKLPAWSVMLILSVIGILVGGTSNLVPEERGGRAATYVGFIFIAVAILLMISGWVFHAAGK